MTLVCCIHFPHRCLLLPVLNSSVNEASEEECEAYDETHEDGHVVFEVEVGEDEREVDGVDLREETRAERSEMVGAASSPYLGRVVNLEKRLYLCCDFQIITVQRCHQWFT